ncbi:uncharacterized protein N7503_001491 [Penicillium pulvis]|uniref:uncharacterized protein n=1 Tax=Penicillium pulvis TaxID=1562058 RepID=UPI0025485AEE|nr:uncharacterized protein N7503_001491 [Penicillium pulvis]KAJ5809273.1 hypothetical protein N7503_001491 [Penicillium pulvis]
MVRNCADLLVLRFLMGFFGGPVVTGFAVQAKGRRWGLWEIVWLTGPLSLLLFCALPETSSDNILQRRAQRI